MGFVQVDNRFFDEYARKVKPTGVALYCLLARHADNGTGKAWPSLEYLMECLGVAKGTVIKHLHTLEVYGLIDIQESEEDGRSHVYLVKQPWKAKEIGSKFEPIGTEQVAEIGPEFEPNGVPEPPALEIGPKFAPIIGAEFEPSPKIEPIPEGDRSKICTQLGSKFEPELDSWKKTETPPEERGTRDRSPPRKAQQIIDAYLEVLNLKLPNGKPDFPRRDAQAKAARQLAAGGYSPEQVQACYRALKAEDFWQGKLLTLMTIESQIGEWLRSGKKPNVTNQARKSGEPRPTREPGGVGWAGERHRADQAEIRKRAAELGLPPPPPD